MNIKTVGAFVAGMIVMRFVIKKHGQKAVDAKVDKIRHKAHEVIDNLTGNKASDEQIGAVVLEITE